MIYLTEEQYQERKLFLRGASTTMLWRNIHPDSVDGFNVLTYDEEKNIYIWFVEKLMRDGEIKLARRGKFLEGSIDEQVEIFLSVFPENEKSMNDDAFDGFWFLSDKCPAGIVWIEEDGSFDWT